MYNRTIVIGNLTRDPEHRFTPGGTALCLFGVASTRKYTDSSGAAREDTLFLDVEAWGKTADLVSKYLFNGSQCLVEGHLKLDTWEDKTTKAHRSKIKLVLENVRFLGSPRDRAPNTGAPAGDAPIEPGGSRFFTRPPAPATPKPKPENLDEDVPF